MAKPKASSNSKPKAKAKTTTKSKVKSEPKDTTVKWVWVLTIAVLAFALIMLFFALSLGGLYQNLEKNSELQKSGVRTSYTQLTSWNENGKKALFYEITLANNSSDSITSWKYEIETNDSVELKEANECQAFISDGVLTVIPKGNSTVEANNKIKFNVILLDNGEDTLSNFTLYVNNEKYSTYSTTTKKTTLLTNGEK